MSKLKNINELAKLNKKRSMTKKALKNERNENRTTWNGIRPCVIETRKYKKKQEQRAKHELRQMLYV